MAEPIPTALKIPEVSRFITRANQLRSIKPIISYWCEYHAVNQIISKNLHNVDEEAFAYTKTLLERLEVSKNQHADEDAIADNDAGKAYVEQFAEETFARAERTMHANKVTRQTADTFDASATFFDLAHVWGQPGEETLQRIKFAKWNAARILKAIRDGRDPNESNPKPREPEAFEEATLDPNDPEVQLLTGTTGPLPASVEEVKDEGDPTKLPQVGPTQEDHDYSAPRPISSNQSYAPVAPSAPSPLASPPLPTQIPPQPSPQIPTKIPATFTPSPIQDGPQWSVPPPEFSGPPPPPPPPQFSPSLAQTHSPQPSPFHQQPPPPHNLPPNAQIPTQFPTQFQPSNPLPPAQYNLPIHPPAPQSAPPQETIPTPAAMLSPGGGGGGSGGLGAGGAPSYHRKDIGQAQKHAKWAISALNFEDVPTAIQELRNALALLGAR